LKFYIDGHIWLIIYNIAKLTHAYDRKIYVRYKGLKLSLSKGLIGYYYPGHPPIIRYIENSTAGIINGLSIHDDGAFGIWEILYKIGHGRRLQKI